MYTTLNQIRAYNINEDGWEKLLSVLMKNEADDDPVSIITILDSSGLNDALWCLRLVKGHDREKRLYAVRCARAVQYLMTDQRSVDALDVAERFANGEVTSEELDAAAAAAAAAATAAAAAGRAAAADAAAAAAAAAAAGRAAAADAAAAAGRAAAAAAAAAAVRATQEKELREMCATISRKD